MLLSSMNKGGEEMLLIKSSHENVIENIVATPIFEPVFDEADTPIYCKCGGKLFLSLRLFRLWINNGIKFRCPKCDSFITSKRRAL